MVQADWEKRNAPCNTALRNALTTGGILIANMDGTAVLVREHCYHVRAFAELKTIQTLLKQKLIKHHGYTEIGRFPIYALTPNGKRVAERIQDNREPRHSNMQPCKQCGHSAKYDQNDNLYWCHFCGISTTANP